MTELANQFPDVVPRSPVAAETLIRPDWTSNQIRSPALLWLDKNENTDPALAQVTSEILRTLPPQALFTYPDNAALYKKLASYVGCSANQLLLTPGSDGAIRAVFETFINEGDIVLHTTPTFAMYPVYCQMYGAQAVGLEYQRRPAGPQLDLENFVRQVLELKPKLVCLPNPDSPTGTLVSESELRSLISAARSVGAVILVDEAYHPFSQFTVAPWIKEFPNLVVARTFAKAWGLAGLRIGYAIAEERVAKLLHKVRPMYEVNTVAVHFIERILDFKAEMEKSVDRLNRGKTYFTTAMQELDFGTLPTHGNFMHVAFREHAAAIHNALKDIVLYRQDFKDPCLAGYSRFSSTTEELFKPVVDAIGKTIRSVK